jgi:hypothetical protein
MRDFFLDTDGCFWYRWPPNGKDGCFCIANTQLQCRRALDSRQ